MIKEALEYLVSLKENQTYTINGETYSDRQLVHIPTYVTRPRAIEVNGLDSVVKLIRTELGRTMTPLFVRVVSPRSVEVFSILDDEMGRDYLYRAECDAPEFRAGWRDHEAAIIELRSAFAPNEGTDYLLDLLSRICKEDGVTSEDNGVSQTVSARQGITLKNYERLKNRVRLAPYRTFTEIDQPESEFILRLDEDTRVGLIEADGGRWKLDAKQRIVSYFEDNLKEQVRKGEVVVMM